ncbi:MAG: hypothetical protein ACLR1U_06930 [Clostridia bacterium]
MECRSQSVPIHQEGGIRRIDDYQSYTKIQHQSTSALKALGQS